MPATLDQFENLLLFASQWVAEQEQIVLRDGLPLDISQLKDARAVGVAFPDRVRILHVAGVPIPTHPELRAFCDATRAITLTTAALSTRYGIWIRSDRDNQRALLVHELVHTAQFERLAGITPFLRQYMGECVTFGYPQAPMEQEAINMAARICG